MKHIRAMLLSVEGMALAGIVAFSVVGALNPKQMVFVALQWGCGLVLLAGEIALYRLDARLHQ